MPSANDRFLIRHHHLPEVENTSISASPYCDRTSRSDIIREKLKIRIVPIAIGMCQVPPIACQQAQSYSRCRSTSIIVSPNPIGPAVQTVFAKKAKNKLCQLSCAKCHQSILNGQSDLPEVETHRSVPLHVAIGPAVRTLFAKGLKIRIVPIAIGMCQVPPIACQQAQSYSRCRSTSIIVSPNPIGPVVQTVFAKRLKIKCANRHVPSATNRFSMGTVIFPRSNHVD